MRWSRVAADCAARLRPVSAIPTETLELPTPHGPARAHVRAVRHPRAALVLGHGAGGGVGAAAVLCLAFPLKPPRRATAKPAPSRLPELDAVTVPMLVIQGERDQFGLPPAGAGRVVVTVKGDHSLRSDLAAVGAAVGSWLGGLNLVP
jgi:hypothetical protein